MASAKHIMYLYSTSSCHLCETAHALIAPYLEQFSLVLEEVDISESDDLMEQYGIRIPVLKFADAEEELGWPFTLEAFLDFVQGREAAGG